MKEKIQQSLSFREMIRRSPCSISVLIAFIISDALIAKGDIAQEDRLNFPWIVAIASAVWVISILVVKRLKQKV